VIGTLTGATDSNGKSAVLHEPKVVEKAVVSNDYSHGSLSGNTITVTRDGSGPLKSIDLQLLKETQPANGVPCKVVSIVDAAGGASNAVTVWPSPTQNTGQVTINGVPTDGVASFSIWGNPNAQNRVNRVFVKFKFEPSDCTQPAADMERTITVDIVDP
jgi:hypothetical protein